MACSNSIPKFSRKRKRSNVDSDFVPFDGHADCVFPNEILAHILAFLDLDDLVYARHASVGMCELVDRECTMNRIIKGRALKFRLHAVVQSYNRFMDMLQCSRHTENGRDLLILPFEQRTILDVATTVGCLDVVRICMELPIYCSPTICAQRAAVHGHIHILEYIRSIPPFARIAFNKESVKTIMLMIDMQTRPNRDVIQWLFQNVDSYYLSLAAYKHLQKY